MATSERLASYDFQKFDNFIQLTLNPPLSEAPWGDIDDLGKNVLNELETARTPSVLVDLSPLTYMGSAMVALIVRIWKATKAKSGEMIVLCSNPMVLKVIALAGLDKVWRITPNAETAYRELKVKPPVMHGFGGNGSVPVMGSAHRSGVTISPTYNAQGALVISKEIPASVQNIVEEEDEEENKSTILSAVLITVAVLSLVLGGTGVIALLKIGAIPKGTSMMVALIGSILAAISATGGIITGKSTAKAIGAGCLLIAAVELALAIFNY